LPAIVADGVDQRLARLDSDRVVAPVDVQRDVDLLAHRGRSLANFVRICASSSLLDRASIGKVSRRDHGRVASITMRALRGSSGAYAIGSSAVLQQPRSPSMPSRGSNRVHIAQITSFMLAGSMSSSTTTTQRLAYAPAWHCEAISPACLAWPPYICLIATVSHMRLPPASCDHTPFTSGTPAASSWFHTAPQR